MKNIVLLFSLVCSLNSWAIESINAVIGDTSYLVKYGALPTADTDNSIRIITHLEYVEQKLREVPQNDLSDAAWQNRIKVLDLLHSYIAVASFPTLPEPFDSRQPCFIDDQGVLCAVAYLVHETTSRSSAVYAINKRHRFDYVLDMNDAYVDYWSATYGLTLTELAMIQPTYSYERRPVDPPQPPRIELPREQALEINLVQLRKAYNQLSQEMKETKRLVQAQSDTISFQEQTIVDQEEEIASAIDKNQALQTQMKEERESLNGEIKKKKRWNIALAGVATTLTSITVFQWIKIRNAE